MRRIGPAAAAGVLTLSLAAPAAASQAPGSRFFGGSYLLRLSSAAVEAQVETADRRLVPGAGHSAVSLARQVGDEHPRCETVAAGAQDDRLAADADAAVPSDLAMPGVLDNRTEQRHSAPNLSPGETFGRSHLRTFPGRATRIPERGPAWHWAAGCHSGTSGAATADDGDLAVAQAAGSRTTAAIDADLEYHGTAHAYLGGLRTGAGSADLSSLLDVWRHPGREPEVSYQIRVAGMPVATGAGVPVSRLATEFARSAEADPDAVALLRRLGLTLVGPTIDTSADGSRQVVHAPYLELTIGQTKTRLLSTSFEGFVVPPPAT